MITDLGQALQGSNIRVHKALEDRISIYCPFHKSGQEHKPSMSVYKDSGMAVCFTCGYKKPVEAFLVDCGLEISVAERIGNAHRSGRPRKIESPALVIGKLSAYHGLFRRFLPKNLLEAGFTREILDLFEIGYDTRYRRVTYPVRDRYGALVAIVGGAIDGNEYAKYKVYSEEVEAEGTQFQHRHHLWGLHLIPANLNPYVIAEGYKACMWVAQAGYDVCATQGTNYTKAQLDLVTEMYKPVVVMMDNDEPGKNAQKRLVTDIIRRIGSRVKSFRYPNGAKQPDDLSPEEIKKGMESAR